MSSRRDPRILAALERLVPVPTADPDELLGGARLRASRRRRARTIPVLLIGAVLLAGAAVAAPAELTSWLRAGDDLEARFSVDPTKRYHGPSPRSVSCAVSGENRLTCTSPVDGGPYELVGDAYPVPFQTRAALLELIAENEEHRAIPGWKARQMRQDAGAVPDDFYEKANILDTLRAAHATFPVSRRPGYLLAPPQGAIAFLGCDSGTAGILNCRALNGTEGLPAGAPLYGLKPDGRWREVEARSSGTDPDALSRIVFEREPSRQERRLLLSMSLLLPYEEPR